MRTRTGWACRDQPGRETSSNSAHKSEPVQALWDRSPSVSRPGMEGKRARSAVKPMLRCTATWRFPMRWHDELSRAVGWPGATHGKVALLYG